MAVQIRGDTGKGNGTLAQMGLTKTKLNAMIEQTWVHVGKYWHRHFRPKHFTERGAREYGYQPRGGENLNPFSKAFKNSYTGRKVRAMKHRRPLEWSGTSKRLSKTARIVGQAKGKNEGARVIMPVRAFNRRSTGQKVNMLHDFSRISNEEIQVLAAEAQNKLIRLFPKNKKVKLVVELK